MVITFFSEDDSAKRSILAVNLAVLYALNHRKVLLIDATQPGYSLGWSTHRDAAGGVKSKVVVRGTEGLQSDLEDPVSYCRVHFRDIIIDADGVDASIADSALVATDVLVIPVRTCQEDLQKQESLVQRIEDLRLFNPALRVLVVDVKAFSAFSESMESRRDSAAGFSRKVPTATLADVVIHEWMDDRRIFERGLSVFECDVPNQHAVAEIKGLYQEVLKIRELPMEASENAIAIMHAIQRRTREKIKG
jgi:chromosome partitioning protein